MLEEIVVIFGVLLLWCVLNQIFHKRKNFPNGPLSLPLVGSVLALGVRPSKILSQMKKRYGNIVAIDFGSYRGIILNDKEIIKKAFNLREIQSRPKLEVTNPVRGENRTGIMWSTGKTSEEQRAFTMRSLKTFGLGKKSMEILMRDQLEKLYNTFDKQVGNVIVNHELFNTTAVGALWSIISGESCEAEDEEFKHVLGMSKIMVRSSTPFVYFFPTVCKLFPNISGWNGFVQSNLGINDFVKHSIQSHKENWKSGGEPRDFIEALLEKVEQTKDENSSFFGKIGIENVVSTLADMLIAGTETSSTSLTWLVAILIRYPDKQTKVQAEIDKVLGSDLPSLHDRQKLPYVEATMFEILRFSALTALGIPHETTADVILNECLIPKGTMVFSNLYSALHDPQQWKDPETFCPERFLNDDESAIIRAISSYVDIVFGYGKRICPGETLAKDQLFLFIAGMCQRYTFLPDPNCYYKSEIDVDEGGTTVPKAHKFIIHKR